jgi:hypothetical protein
LSRGLNGSLATTTTTTIQLPTARRPTTRATASSTTFFPTDAEQTSGFASLLRPRSDDFGVIDLSARPLPSLFEDEPENQSADDATFLPEDDEDRLPFGAAAGVIDESDVDLCWCMRRRR